MLRTCRKCNEEKPETKDYFKFGYKQNKKGERFLYLEYTCKFCYNKYKKEYDMEYKNKETRIYNTLETIDGMIEFAQSLGFKSASYAIDKYGKEQFKKMYYENRQANI